MKIHSILCTLAGLVLSVGLTVHAEEQEQRIKLADAPTAVQETFQKQAAGGKIVSVTKESENNAVHYEAVIQKAGTTLEVTAAADGAWQETEERVELKNLPEKVRATIQAQAARNKITEVNKVTTCKQEQFYEAEFKKDGKEEEVRVAADGKLLAKEP